MKTSGIKAADAAVWSNTWSDSGFTGSRKESGENLNSKDMDKAANLQTHTDEIVFSQKSEQGPQEKTPAGSQVKQLLNLVEDSNDKMKEMLMAIKPAKTETTAVPSAIGLTVSAAAAKLKANDLKVSGIFQEYSSIVPEGHVISQMPGPGSRLAKRGGIRLIISKGKPPVKEKHDPIRQQEKVILPPDVRDSQESGTEEAAVIPPDPSGIKLII